METVLEDCTSAYPLRVLSLRYFNPIGADPRLRTGLQARRPTHLLGQMITAVDTDQEFLLTGVDWPTRDGSGIRDYIHVWDLAMAHVLALRRFDQLLPVDGEPKYEVINLGTGNGTTVREFVEAFSAVAEKPLRVRETSPRPGDVVGSYTRIDKARATLGWEPHLSIADAIRDSMRWSAVRDSRLDT
jgi:UDP-glucose 4-epimerase